MAGEGKILLIDKPKGITSFDVVQVIRKKLNVQKVGHAGTLDPLATGLMLVGVGEGTKELTEYIKLPKEYLAEICVGERRTTGDMEGNVTEEVVVSGLDEESVQQELRGMIGIMTLPVSAYSAIKKGGVPMYKRARRAAQKGEELTEVPCRDMEVMEAELLGITSVDKRCLVRVRFYVGSGTYIRSLAEELGRRLGYPATLYSLRRTRIGEFDVVDAEEI